MSSHCSTLVWNNINRLLLHGCSKKVRKIRKRKKLVYRTKFVKTTAVFPRWWRWFQRTEQVGLWATTWRTETARKIANNMASFLEFIRGVRCGGVSRDILVHLRWFQLMQARETNSRVFASTASLIIDSQQQIMTNQKSARTTVLHGRINLLNV